MRRARTLALLLALFTTSSAWSQIGFTPRVSRYHDNTMQRVVSTSFAIEDDIGAQMAALTAEFQSAFGPTASFEALDIDAVSSSDQVDFKLAGATLTANLRNDRTQLAFTLLTGDGAIRTDQMMRNTLRFTLAGFETTDLWVATVQNRVEIERADFEFTFQHRLNETFALVGGVRMEESKVTTRSDATLERSNNTQTLVSLLLGGDLDLGLAEPFTSSSEGRGKSRLYSLRFGAAAYAPVGERSVFFASGLLHVSHETGDEGFITSSAGLPGLPTSTAPTPAADENSIGPDLTVGFVRRIGERFDFDTRYRASAFFPDSDSDNPRVNHGLSMGFTFWFGR